MLESIGKLPFAIQVEKSRESIQNHQAQQQVQKEHLLAHKLEKVLERQKLDLMLSYDKFGRETHNCNHRDRLWIWRSSDG